jgi:hypothetical protein
MECVAGLSSGTEKRTVKAALQRSCSYLDKNDMFVDFVMDLDPDFARQDLPILMPDCLVAPSPCGKTHCAEACAHT